MEKNYNTDISLAFQTTATQLGNVNKARLTMRIYLSSFCFCFKVKPMIQNVFLYSGYYNLWNFSMIKFRGKAKSLNRLWTGVEEVKFINYCIPELGHSSHVGLSTPARQASQNHGSVEQEELDDDTLALSWTP